MTGAEKRMRKIFQEYEKKGIRKTNSRYGKFNNNNREIIMQIE